MQDKFWQTQNRAEEIGKLSCHSKGNCSYFEELVIISISMPNSYRFLSMIKTFKRLLELNFQIFLKSYTDYISYSRTITQKNGTKKRWLDWFNSPTKQNLNNNYKIAFKKNPLLNDI